MKKLKTIVFVCGLCLFGSESHAQLVSVRVNLPSPPPPRACATRPPCPSPDYIWREGRWIWDDYVRDYVWSAGYWEYAQPRRPEAPPVYSRHGKGHGRGHWKDRDRKRDRD